MSDDPRLEIFLKQFRPRRPPPLPRQATRPAHHRWILTAAAVIVLVAGVWRWAPRSERPAEAPPVAPRGHAFTLTALNAALRAGTHESVLDGMSRRLLPDPSRPGGALRVLADVDRDRGEP